MADQSSGEKKPAASVEYMKEGATTRSSTQSSTKTPSGTELPDQFVLEDLYPSAHDVFAPSCVQNVRHGDALIVLDTNTLLVPYGIKQDDLTALQAIYKGLADAGRLFLPGRVAREFIKHRDAKLAEMLKALNDQKSRFKVPDKRLSPLLEGVPGYDELRASQEKLAEARKSYDANLAKMIDKLRSWRGDDPVTNLYREVFTSSNVIEVLESRENLSSLWSVRIRNKTPPGYKDSGKDDLGIGDFIIWKTILQLGKEYCVDLVFVTGEEKSDWFVRSGGEGAYPRPELVDEYRRSSGGKSISLLSLSEFLTEMHVEDKIVEEFRNVEFESAIEASKFEASKADILYQGKIPVPELREILSGAFPDRVRSSDSSLGEFSEELFLVGVSSALDAKSKILMFLSAALESELKEHGKIYYHEIGIARECMLHAYRGYRDIMEKVSGTRRV